MSELATITVEVYADSDWVDISADVMRDARFSFEYGIKGLNPTSRVASPGRMDITLDNSDNNSAGVEGYYTPGHSSVLTGFETEIPIRVTFTYGGDTFYKFVGRIADIDPDAAQYGDRLTKIKGKDFIAQAATLKPDELAVQENKRGNELIATALLAVEKQPTSTKLDSDAGDDHVGKSIFEYSLDEVRDDKTTLLQILKNVAVSEQGTIAVTGDSDTGGVLTFWNRHARITDSDILITLSDPADDSEHDSVYEWDKLDLVNSAKKDISNRVRATIFPRLIDDVDETTVLWKLGEEDIPQAGGNAEWLDGYTSSQFSLSSHSHEEELNVNDLGDVTITAAALGDFLRHNGSAWVDVDINQLLTDLKTVDGTGSGLDADKLDGQEGAYYALWTDKTTYLHPTDTTDKISIGADTAPDGVLHIFEGSAGTVDADSGANTVVIEHSGDGGFSFLTPDANWGQFVFGSPTVPKGAWVSHNHNLGRLDIVAPTNLKFDLRNTSGWMIWNDNAYDVDMRWESDDEPYFLTLDSGENKLVVGQQAPDNDAILSITDDDWNSENHANVDEYAAFALGGLSTAYGTADITVMKRNTNTGYTNITTNYYYNRNTDAWVARDATFHSTLYQQRVVGSDAEHNFYIYDESSLIHQLTLAKASATFNSGNADMNLFMQGDNELVFSMDAGLDSIILGPKTTNQFPDGTDNRLMIFTDGADPGYPIGTVTEGANNIFQQLSVSSTGTHGAGFLARYARGTFASPTQTQSGDRLGFFLFGGLDDSSNWGNHAGFIGFTTQAYTSAARGTRLDLLATAQNAASRSTVMSLYGEGHIDSFGGTSNPTTNISAGSLFYRTDLHMWIEYDGTRWLSCNEYATQHVPKWYSATTTWRLTGMRADYDFYLTHVALVYYISGTNDGSNYWTFDSKSAALNPATTTTLDSFDTSADSGSTWLKVERAPNTAATHSSNNHWWVMTATKTGSPGNMLVQGTFYYRLIIT
jgi:hypothetical protein